MKGGRLLDFVYAASFLAEMPAMPLCASHSSANASLQEQNKLSSIVLDLQLGKDSEE